MIESLFVAFILLIFYAIAEWIRQRILFRNELQEIRNRLREKAHEERRASFHKAKAPPGWPYRRSGT